LDLNDEKWGDWSRLMGLVQEGDMEAYARLLYEIGPLIFNYVRKRVYHPSQVEDVYQDALLTFHRARHTYQLDRPFGPWLFTVIRHAIWGSLERRHKVTAKELQVERMPERPVPEKDEDPLSAAMSEALRSLPEKTRVAVELLKVQGLDVQTAARELGISEAALRVRAHRGYAQLRKKLTRDN
jgi:RNA polymerase sigma-70 factor (ECF subfamily)